MAHFVTLEKWTKSFVGWLDALGKAEEMDDLVYLEKRVSILENKVSELAARLERSAATPHLAHQRVVTDGPRLEAHTIKNA